jgi:polyisoprenoid-binding protein YceI
MKKLLLLLSLLTIISFNAEAQKASKGKNKKAETEKEVLVKPAAPTLKSKTINVDNSTITWKAYKVTGEHQGDLKIKSGELQFAEDILVGGSFVIDMTTINTTDLEGEWKDKLDGHLKSADLFDIANHETATLKITKVAAKGTLGDYKIMGDLTIKGTTAPIKFYANIGDKEAKADVKVDRTEYNIQYGSGSFFDSLGDKTIYDEFDLTISLSF